jgi:Leucine-rich repeat (LRR) protein
MNVSKSSFSYLPHLNTLRLIYISNMKEKGAFQALFNLRNLFLSHNDLGLHDNSQALFGIYSVETLDLSYNSLVVLPDLSSATNLKSLDVSDNLLFSIPDLGILHNLVELNIAENPLENDNFPPGFKQLRNFSKITIGIV